MKSVYGIGHRGLAVTYSMTGILPKKFTWYEQQLKFGLMRVARKQVFVRVRMRVCTIMVFWTSKLACFFECDAMLCVIIY